MRPAALACVLLVLLLTSTANAAVESVQFATPEQARRYRSLTEELRCLVCQNQNIADSNADLAKDLRRQIREMIERGDSDRTITDFMVARYGEFVLYRPPFKAVTALLWLGPFLFLAVGLAVLIVIIRKRAHTGPTRLSEPEKARVRQLLDAAKDE
jgi:cytochrome c-type biogenesis protein CcmH